MELKRYVAWFALASLAVVPISIYARTIKGITIEATGQSDIKEDPPSAGCKEFRPTIGQVRQYFNKAYPVPARVGFHDRYSPCYAMGTVEFSDNTAGKWKISSGGTGTLFWDSGDAVTLFYRGYKWHDPFACMYGLSSEPEC